MRTLRDLGMGLDDVREVLARRRGIDEVAAAHVRAIDNQIRSLRVQRAVCTLLARGGHDEKEMKLMNDLTRLSAAERQQVIDEFVDVTFADADPDAPSSGIAAAMRTMPAELPDDPSTEQVQAWVELAELAGDESFRARVREMALAGSERPESFDPSPVQEHAGAACCSRPLMLVVDTGPGSAEVPAQWGWIRVLEAQIDRTDRHSAGASYNCSTHDHGDHGRGWGGVARRVPIAGRHG